MGIGDRIKLLRERCGIERDDLAKKIGITYHALAKYETNERTPDPEIINKFADFFDVTTDYLLGRTTTTIALSRSDNRTDDLPPEALEKIEEFKELMRLKYGKKPTT